MILKTTGIIAALLITAGFSFAANIDLSTAGATGFVGGAYLEQFSLPGSSGSGVVNSFLVINGNRVEKGYNTLGTTEFDTASPNAIQVQDIPLVALGFGNYYEFLIDLNQDSANPLISLDTLQLFTATTSNQTGYVTSPAPAIGSAVNVFDSAGDTATLSAAFSSGSGGGDYLVYIPQSVFAGNSPTDYVYLFAQLGATNSNNGGFEEFYISASSNTSLGGGTIVGTDTPEPSTLWMGLAGFLLAAGARRFARA